MRNRRIAATVLAASGIAAAVVVMAAAGSGVTSSEPTREELDQVQELVRARSGQLAREGIYVVGTGQPVEEDCVAIRVLNPTRPNVEYLQREFGPDVCVQRGSYLYGCGDHVALPPPRGQVIVPDLRGSGLYEAQRKVVADGLTYAINCLGERKAKPARLPRDSPDRLARVVGQCPRAGERVVRGTEVALQAAATLPGRHRFEVGVLGRVHTGTSTPCRDGRTPVRARGKQP